MTKTKKYSFYWIQDGVLKNSSKQTAEESLAEFREEPIGPVFKYATCSVERNMFLCHLRESLEIASPEDKEELLEKGQKMLDVSPYTNYGD